jgi:hypothetical protein
MLTIHQPVASTSPAPPVLRRACACGGTPGPTGECEQCRKKRLGLQRSPFAAGPAVAPPIVHDVLRSSGAPLDSAVRAEMEPRFRHSFADVRVHADGRAAESARAVGAHAYAVGPHVVFGAGRYAPGSGEGRRLIAHELAHVIQQRGASASIQPKLEIGAAEDQAEREAEAAAERVSRGGAAAALNGGRLALRRVCSQHPDESWYLAAPNYCRDTGFSGSLHPGQRCYREVPRRTSYWNCPPGDQVCFDAGGRCHDSWDRASTVESRDPDGSCNLHGWCFMQHAALDIVPGVMEPVGEAMSGCVRTCQAAPWYLRGFCMQGCSPGGIR